MPDPLYRRGADTAERGHTAATPVRGLRGSGLSLGNNLRLLGARQGRETQSTRAILIKCLDPAFHKAPPPIEHRRTRCPKFPGQRVVRFAVRRAKNDPCPQRDPLLRLAGTDDSFKLPPALSRCR